MATAEEPAGELRVTVAISPKVPAFHGATLYARLEEVSRADAPATLVADASVRGVSHAPPPGAADGTCLTLVLRVPPMARIDARRDYAVRAWIEFGAGGPSAPAGLSSTQRHPVLTRGFGREATIRLGPGQ